MESTYLELRHGASALSITCGDEVLAEEICPGGKKVRVWPSRRMLLPPSGGEIRFAPAWALPDGHTWPAIFSRVDAERMATIARFPSHHWPLLEFAHNHAPFRDLLHTNPVLAYAMACNDELHKTTPAIAARRATLFATRRQREVAGLLDFPATEATVKLLRRIEPEAVNPSILRLLMRSLPLAAPLATRVAHLPRLNAGILAFLIHPTLRSHAAPELLAELASAPEEHAAAPTADQLFDIARMRADIPQPPALPACTSRRQIHRAHHHVLLAFLAAEEQRRRAGEARAEQLRQQARRQAEAVAPPAAHVVPAARPPRPPRQAATPPKQPKPPKPPPAFPSPPLKGTETIVPLTSEAALRLEGYEQQNCVATYAPRVIKEFLYIYKVLAPERATLSIVMKFGEWKVSELKLKGNRTASRKTYAAVYHWLETNPARRQQPIWRDAAIEALPGGH